VADTEVRHFCMCASDGVFDHRTRLAVIGPDDISDFVHPEGVEYLSFSVRVFELTMLLVGSHAVR